METRELLSATAIFGVLLSATLKLGEPAGFTDLPRILALSFFAVVPLALHALRDVGPRTARLLRVTSYVVPVTAAAATLSFLHATPAGAWVLPWGATSGLLAVVGASHWLEGSMTDPARVSAVAGLVMSMIGAGWLFIARQDLTVMGFRGTMALLTAVHFHVAAVGALAITARVIDALSGRARRIAATCGGAIVLAFPLVAIGLTGAPAVALVGATLLTVSLLVVSGFLIGPVRRRFARQSAKVLAVISAGSLWLSMPLAFSYQLGQVAGTPHLDLTWMVRLHGYANAHGVVTCGLFAFLLEDRWARGHTASSARTMA